MKTPLMSVPVAEIEREGSVQRDWELPIEWLCWALAGTEAEGTENPGRISVQLLKNGREILIRGELSARVRMPCARTLDPALYDLGATLTLILHRKREASSTSRASKPAARKRAKKAEESALQDEDAASDTFSGENIVLDDFVREQLLLELPMFPLRSDLRSDTAEAIPSPPQLASSGADIDPRLLPLQALADKLRKN